MFVALFVHLLALQMLLLAVAALATGHYLAGLALIVALTIGLEQIVGHWPTR